jgi:Zn-dependent protease
VIDLLMQGQVALFAIIVFAIIFSLTCHEFGHAAMATYLGDPTAQQAGRLTLNPVVHIDPLGLLMVVMVGFGYAKPVPFNPRYLKQTWGSAAVAFAGPAMNLLLAIVAVNLLVAGVQYDIQALSEPGPRTTLLFLAQINVLLMLFNLIPLGPLDGHHIMQSLLPPDLSRRYQTFNDKFGAGIFLVLIVLSVMGLPVFRFLSQVSNFILPLLTFV